MTAFDRRAGNGAVALALAASFAAAALPAACASAPPRVPTAQLPACRVEAGEGWREVSADTTLRFCVPVSWRAGGSRAWRGEGVVEWGFGSAPELREIGVTVVRVRAGNDRPASTPVMPVGSVERLYEATETIHGAAVRVSMMRIDDTFHTGASWSQPVTIHFSGEAPSRSAALEQLEVYRTARVTAH